MHIIELIARNAYPGAIPDDNNNFDALLAYPIFKTPFEKLPFLGKLPQYLDGKGLPLSAIACRYELGYYDEKMLQEHNESEEKVDEFMKMWANQPAWDQIRYDPWYGFEKESVLQSRIMGCTFKVRSKNDMFSIEFATTLLATLECFLGTGFYNKLYSRVSIFEIEINKSPKESFSIEVGYSRDNPTYMSITISEFNNAEFQHAHGVLSSKLIEIISTIISAMLISNDDFQKLKEMVENEFVLARTEVFTDSLFYGYSTFGPEVFTYSKVVREFDEEPLIRSQKVVLHEESDPPDDEEIEKRNVIYGSPPGFSPHQSKNDEVLMTDIISIPLWDLGNWCGTLFLIYQDYLPVLSLIFKNEAGLKIFDEWINKYGTDDRENEIGIRIIKGIDSEHPYWYRIGIGSNSFFSNLKGKTNHIIINPCRMHTMQPSNDKNIGLFEHLQSKTGDYVICPSIIREGKASPETHLEKQILKHAGSIRIMNAYEIEKTDVLAVESIIPADKPIIPPECGNCDIVEILTHKKTISNK